MLFSAHVMLVVCACLLDAWLGDPVYRLHPVRLLGDGSQLCERWLFRLHLQGYLGGVLHGLAVVGGALAVWWGMGTLLGALHPWLTWLWDLLLAYSLLCMRDLYTHGLRVYQALGDLVQARRALAMMVGRDTDSLDQGGVVRASIESLSENLTDGVLTPLWALCLFGLPGLIVVKAVSTLDSMVGYKTARYRRFGWAAARADDLVHWLPARLSVPLIMLAAGLMRLHPLTAYHTARRDHGHLASPNSGWSEAAFAGALQVRLLGPIHYRGELRNQEYLGDPAWPADLNARHLHQALQLLRVCMVLAVMIGLGLALLASSWR